MLVVNAALAILGSYFVMLGSPNYYMVVVPLDTIPLNMYYLAIGAHFTMFSVGVAEVLRQRTKASFIWLGVGLAMGSAIIGLVVLTGMFGWLNLIMIATYIIPLSTLVYFLRHPEGSTGESDMQGQQTKEIARCLSVDDTTKGLKLTLYTIIVVFSSIATLGINSMGMAKEDVLTNNLVFWLMVGGGAVVAAVLANFLLQRHLDTESTAWRDRATNIWWLVFVAIHAMGMLAIATLEFYMPGFHLSIVAQIAGGILLGFSIGAYFAMIAVQHPPRCNYAYYMFLAFFVILSVAVSSYLKVQAMDLGEFYGLAEYVIYVIAGAGVLVVLLVIAQVVTIVKKGKGI